MRISVSRSFQSAFIFVPFSGPCDNPGAMKSLRSSVVPARPQAKKPAELGPNRPGLAKPKYRPEMAFGPALDLVRPGPSRQAVAFTYTFGPLE